MNAPRHRSSNYRMYLYPGTVIVLATLLFVLLYQLDVQKVQLNEQGEMLLLHSDIVRQLAQQTILLNSYRRADLERLNSKLYIARLVVDMAPHLNDNEVVQLANVVHDQSARYGYDWKWLLALIQAESDFDPKARSTAGACGLMQIMPDTAHDIATKLGIPYEEKSTLFNVEHNIRIGAYYFYQLVQKFGNYEKAIAAYNHGPTGLLRSDREGQELASEYRKKILSTYARLSAISPS